MVKGNLPVWHAVEWDNEGPNLCLKEGYHSTSVSQIDSCTVCTHGYNFFRPVLTFWTKASKGFLGCSINALN